MDLDELVAELKEEAEEEVVEVFAGFFNVFSVEVDTDVISGWLVMVGVDVSERLELKDGVALCDGCFGVRVVVELSLSLLLPDPLSP